MSAGAIIISTKRGLLKEFATELIKNNFNIEVSRSIVVSRLIDNDGIKLTDRIFIDDGEEIFVDKNGFEEFEIQEYRRLLNEESCPLIHYYFKYHDRDFIIDILLVVANRSDVVIDDDDSLIVRGDEFAQHVNEFK